MSYSPVTDAAMATTLAAMAGSVAAAMLRRRPAALRHLVWRVTVAAFVAVPAMTTMVALGALRPLDVAMPLPAVRPVPALPPPNQSLASRPRGPVLTPDRATAPSMPAAPSLPSLPLLPVAAVGLWLLGSVVSAGSLLRQWFAVRRLRRSAADLGLAQQSLRIAHWSRRMGLAAPQVVSSPDVTAPTVLGWHRPVIILPLAAPVDGPGVDGCFLHELAHISRRDVPWFVTSRVLQLVWWWHPLLWLAVRGLRDTAEQACDDWAVALSGQAKPYATLLVQYAEAAAGTGLALGSKGRALTTRVRRILAGVDSPVTHLPAGLRGLVIVLGIVVVVASGCTRWGAKGARGASAPPSSAVRGANAGLPSGAIAKLDLSFYVVSQAWVGNTRTAGAPAGYRIITAGEDRYLVREAPDFSSSDVTALRWISGTQQLDSGGRIGRTPAISFTMRDPGKWQTVLGRNAGKQLLVLSGSALLESPIIRNGTGGGGVLPLAFLPRDKWDMLRPYLKGLPCSEGLAVEGRPQEVPGTGRLTFRVHHAGAGKVQGQCDFTPGTISSPGRTYPTLAPTAIWDGDLVTVINISPGAWHYRLYGSFTPTDKCRNDVLIRPGDNGLLDISVTGGATIRGRVVSAEDGSPMPQAAIGYVPPGQAVPDTTAHCPYRVPTDAQGRFALANVAPHARLLVVAAHGAPVTIDVGDAREGERKALPDIRIQRGR